jgi:ABC-type multidrug transport system fused ATPase/permease subunit
VAGGLANVMNGGRIIEYGTHKELPAAQGFFGDLCNSYFVEALVEAS